MEGTKKVDARDRLSKEEKELFYSNNKHLLSKSIISPHSENARTTFKKRLTIEVEGEDRKETAEEAIARTASLVAIGDRRRENASDEQVLQTAEKFHELMIYQYGYPNSPAFTGAMTPIGQLSACFVLPIDDSMDGIFTTLKNTAFVHQSGGGTGFSFNRIRPKNDRVSSTQGKASGPVSFMRVYNAATETIKQGGTRRGANMGILNIDHPDIMEWIYCKRSKVEFQNFNLSVGLTEDFMQKAENGEYYSLINPRTQKPFESSMLYRDFKSLEEVALALGKDVSVLERYKIAKSHEKEGKIDPVYERDFKEGKELEKILNEHWKEERDGIKNNKPSLLLTGDGRKVLINHRIFEPERSALGSKPAKILSGLYERKNGLELGIVDAEGNVQLSAKTVFDEIVESAHATGDPGILFIDRMNRDNPYPSMGEIESTNPCGEQPLLPYESCNLFGFNLGNYSKRKHFDGVVRKNEGDISLGEALDLEKLARDLPTGVQLLDNMIEMNTFPIPEIEEMTKKGRRIGIGFMGFADLLIKNGIPYGSEAGLKIAEEVTKFVMEGIEQATMDLAERRGAFPLFEQSIYAKKGMRKMSNAAPGTIAPNGTTSIIGDCSSGIEPLHAVSYVRNVMDNTLLYYIHPEFERIGKEEGWLTDEVRNKVADNEGSVQGIEEIPKYCQEVFLAAHDISIGGHISTQARVQKSGLHNACSKTINLGEHATIDEVAKVYKLAWKEGVKGCTLFRDKSKSDFADQVIKYGGRKDSGIIEVAQKIDLQNYEWANPMFPRIKGERLPGFTIEYEVKNGPNLFLSFTYDAQKRLNQIFINRGKSGGDESANSESKGKLISIGLQHGVPPQVFIKTLQKIQSDVHPISSKGIFTSIESAIADAMRDYVVNELQMDPNDLSPAGYAVPRFRVPDTTFSIKHKLRLPEGPPAYLSLSELPEGVLGEVFISRGNSGQQQNAHFESLGKISSIDLQYGINPAIIINLLQGIQSNASAWVAGGSYKSIEDFTSAMMANWLLARGFDPYEKKGIESVIGEHKILTEKKFLKPPCPGCGSSVYNILKLGRECETYSCCGANYGSCG